MDVSKRLTWRVNNLSVHLLSLSEIKTQKLYENGLKVLVISAKGMELFEVLDTH